MRQPKYSFWGPIRRHLNYQENTTDGPQISKIADCFPGYDHTISSKSETIDNGAKTHAYTKERTVIDTRMVHVTLPFDNVKATQNVIRVKYPDGNLVQATHSDILKLSYLPVKARHVHLFDSLTWGLLISLVKLFDAGCTAYFNAKNSTYYFRAKLSSNESDPPPLPSCGKKYHKQYQEDEEVQLLNSVIGNP